MPASPVSPQYVVRPQQGTRRQDLFHWRNRKFIGLDKLIASSLTADAGVPIPEVPGSRSDTDEEIESSSDLKARCVLGHSGDLGQHVLVQVSPEQSICNTLKLTDERAVPLICDESVRIGTLPRRNARSVLTVLKSLQIDFGVY